jgi:RNA polymerase II subunit A C-terminal domain phosphatase SSU72
MRPPAAPGSLRVCLCMSDQWCESQVKSFGVGSRVKLPGASRNDPNVYEFGKVTYEDIYKDLEAKDAALYARNGLLQMLQRDMAVKSAPERWQDYR